MHIILVSDRLATAKTISLSGRHLALAMGVLLLTVLGLSSVFWLITLRHAAELRLPFIQEIALSMRAEESQRTQSFMRDNLNAMAIKIGEIQAKVLRLDSLGERVGGMVGIKPQELKAPDKPGQGGPLIEPTRAFSAEELRRQLDLLAQQVDLRSDYLGLVESELLDERVRSNLLPTTLPVQADWNTSGYGVRIDPFTGHRAMHEGVDFPGEVGTPISAAAAGMVIVAEVHPGYGNLIEIDHGKGLTTRYAHCSRLLVQPGVFVRRGQKIAELGSTGRSTGPHLHFEVRANGASMNPNNFLRHAQQTDLALAPRLDK